MLRQTWAELGSIVSRRERRAIIVIGVESALAAALEALVLVTIVSAIVEATSTDGSSLEAASSQLGGVPGGAWIPWIAAAAMVVLHVHVAWLSARTAGDVLHLARSTVLQSYAGADWSTQSEHAEGTVLDSTGTLALRTSAVAVQVAICLGAGLSLVALVSLSMLVSPAATLAAIALGGALFSCLRPIRRLTSLASTRFVERNGVLTEKVSEWVGLAMDVRAFGVSAATVDVLEQDSRSTAAALARSQFASRVGSEWYRDLAVVALIVTASLLGKLDPADAARIGAALLLLMRSLSYAQMLNNSLQQIREYGPNLSSLRARSQHLEAARTRFGTAAAPEGAPDLAFVDVSYRYEASSQRGGISHVTFDVAAGSAVGLVGPSGAGKSTVGQLVMRLRQPTAGEICVGGTDYRTYAEPGWRRLVAMVPQEPRLFRGTIGDNIGFWRPQVSRDDVRDAASAARIYDEIRQLPDGFDTRLGPRGIGLSGGQKQRIAIARALAGGASMIVFDEPTSALDGESEELVRASLEGLLGRVTLVVIAHRPSALELCESIVTLRNGGVTDVTRSSTD